MILSFSLLSRHLAVLNAFSRSKRFGLALTFMGKKTKTQLVQLFEHMRRQMTSPVSPSQQCNQEGDASPEIDFAEQISQVEKCFLGGS